jgi:hypothetical protein
MPIIYGSTGSLCTTMLQIIFLPLSDTANAQVRTQLQNYGSVSRRPIINGSIGSWCTTMPQIIFSPPLSDPANAKVRIQLLNYGSVSRRPIIYGWDLADCSGWDLAEWLERLTANAKAQLSWVRSQHPPDTVESERGGKWRNLKRKYPKKSPF